MLEAIAPASGISSSFLASSTRTSCRQSSPHMDNASLTLVSASKFATIKLSRFGTERRFSMGKARVSLLFNDDVVVGWKYSTEGTAKAVKTQGRSLAEASTLTNFSKSGEISRCRVWNTCPATWQKAQLALLYRTTTASKKKYESYYYGRFQNESRNTIFLLLHCTGVCLFFAWEITDAKFLSVN